MKEILARQTGGYDPAFFVHIIAPCGYIWIVANQRQRLGSSRQIVPFQMGVTVTPGAQMLASMRDAKGELARDGLLI